MPFPSRYYFVFYPIIPVEVLPGHIKENRTNISLQWLKDLKVFGPQHPSFTIKYHPPTYTQSYLLVRASVPHLSLSSFLRLETCMQPLWLDRLHTVLAMQGSNSESSPGQTKGGLWTMLMSLTDTLRDDIWNKTWTFLLLMSFSVYNYSNWEETIGGAVGHTHCIRLFWTLKMHKHLRILPPSCHFPFM